jgi:transcriptional antiterminator RfaH
VVGEINFVDKINWYAIQTKPAREELAATYLTRMDIEVLLPKVIKERRMWGTAKQVLKPLFSSYLFGRFTLSTHLHAVRYARGVRRVVGIGDTPYPVSDSIIQDIKNRMDSNGSIQLEPNRVKAGQHVRIVDGTLKGWSGVFEKELDNKQRVAILLSTVEYQARVLLNRSSIEAV